MATKPAGQRRRCHPKPLHAREEGRHGHPTVPQLSVGRFRLRGPRSLPCRWYWRTNRPAAALGRLSGLVISRRSALPTGPLSAPRICSNVPGSAAPLKTSNDGSCWIPGSWSGGCCKLMTSHVPKHDRSPTFFRYIHHAMSQPSMPSWVHTFASACLSGRCCSPGTASYLADSQRLAGYLVYPGGLPVPLDSSSIPSYSFHGAHLCSTTLLFIQPPNFIAHAFPEVDAPGGCPMALHVVPPGDRDDRIGPHDRGDVPVQGRDTLINEPFELREV